ncbi:MAG: cysteine--tRNA ligase, partial [Bacteroidetes bacterium HGW-Bacteroidetes-9]
TINGQKMGKSLGNFITLDEFMKGEHKALTKAYSPMTIRFFILQAHYRSTLDFSNEALLAAEKGLDKLLKAWATLGKITASDKSSVDVNSLRNNCYEAMNDDFNSPIVIANLFEGVRIINSVNDKKESLSADDLHLLRDTFNTFTGEILGLKQEEAAAGSDETLNGLMQLILDLRKNAKTAKDFATADKIRDELTRVGISVKDTKDGAEWSLQ